MPFEQILVVYGRVGDNKAVQCYHGGGTFVWPLIQGCAFLDLTPRTIHIPLKGRPIPPKHPRQRSQHVYSGRRLNS
jgi:hypothetical protein